MRGPRRPCVQHRPSLRFIPAHAGTTPPRRVRRVPAAVHPRACGDHLALSLVCRGSPGSSPRMRGPHVGPAQACELTRFIPAHAGTTRASRTHARHGAVHPRACGDHATRSAPARMTCGSSPRMRGPRARHGSPARGRAVHPRACGDHEKPARDEIEDLGSSPRMRGPRMRAGGPGAPTPVHPRACGDHEGRGSGSTEGRSVHPRACGDHGCARLTYSVTYGSSPRMRGPPEPLDLNNRQHRFIPAHAGTTASTGMCTSHEAVHPRACGDHVAVDLPTIH